jgi:hypothetical protein
VIMAVHPLKSAVMALIAFRFETVILFTLLM